MSEGYKIPNGEVPAEVPEKTSEEPDELSGGEQNNGPVKG